MNAINGHHYKMDMLLRNTYKCRSNWCASATHQTISLEKDLRMIIIGIYMKTHKNQPFTRQFTEYSKKSIN